MKLFGNSSEHKHEKPHTKDGAHHKEHVFDESSALAEHEKAGAHAAHAGAHELHASAKKFAGKRSGGDGSGGGGKKLSARKKLLIALGVFAVIILGVVIGYSIWEEPPDINTDGITVQNTPTPTPDGSGAAEPTPSPGTGGEEPGGDNGGETEETPEPVDSSRKEDCYTFVIAASDVVGANTDTLLVGRFDIGGGTLSVASIPRDTLVNVDWGVKKINTVLDACGNDPEEFRTYLSDILGFKVDCYAIVDVKALEEIIDCIGGVYYDIPRYMDYDDPTQNLSIHFAPGYQWLSGEDAVKVLRFRMGNNDTGYANGDLGRIATQQDFLMSIASQMLTLGNIPNLTKAIEIFEEYVQTDLSANNLAYFAREFLLMDKENISFMTASGVDTYIRGGSYYEIHVDEWVTMINEHLSPYKEEITRANLNVLYTAANGEIMSTTGETVPLWSFFDYFSLQG